MRSESLDRLLERLSAGDRDAAERIFVTYEPYLRTVVRRGLSDRLRAKFDSLDVVQSVWVHVLHGLDRDAWRFVDRAGLIALLTTVTRHRLVTRYRAHQAALAREEPGSPDLELVPAQRGVRPSEIAEAQELWERMLALCPPQHHEVLRLKREGLRLQEIAERTGLHEGSVRRILRRLAREMILGRRPLASSAGVQSGANDPGPLP